MKVTKIQFDCNFSSWKVKLPGEIDVTQEEIDTYNTQSIINKISSLNWPDSRSDELAIICHNINQWRNPNESSR